MGLSGGKKAIAAAATLCLAVGLLGPVGSTRATAEPTATGKAAAIAKTSKTGAQTGGPGETQAQVVQVL